MSLPPHAWQIFYQPDEVQALRKLDRLAVSEIIPEDFRTFSDVWYFVLDEVQTFESFNLPGHGTFSSEGMEGYREHMGTIKPLNWGTYRSAKAWLERFRQLAE